MCEILQEASTGINLITSEHLGTFDRGIAGAGIVVGPLAKGVGKGIKWSNVLIEGVRKSLKERKIHSYIREVNGVEVADTGVALVGSVMVKTIAPSTKTTKLTTYWPSNSGFLNSPEGKYLMPGELIDRFGFEGGKFFSPKGTPFEMRGLPSHTRQRSYNIYEVKKPFEVREGLSTPAFDSIGLGIQYESPITIDILIKRGIIERVTEI